MSSGHPSTTLTGSAGAQPIRGRDLGANGTWGARLTSTHPLQKRNGMMEPDDFRACLISMGYDLVSAPASFQECHNWFPSPILSTCCAPPPFPLCLTTPT